MSALGDLILSIRDKIPDRVSGDDPYLDGKAFSVATLLRWLNDAGRLMCHRANVITDWYGVPSINGQSIYELPTYITTVEQVWFDLIQLSRAPEGDTLFATSSPIGQSWWFGPHSTHATPRLYVFPAPNRNAGATLLNGGLTATALSATVDSTTDFEDYGFVRFGTATVNELVRYNSKTATTLTNMLRGQGGTKGQSWVDDTPVTECNLFFKGYRLPVPMDTLDDILEVPQGLWPVLELYVLANVREAEQDHETAMQMRGEFHKLVDDMADKAPTKGLRQGLQVKLVGAMTELYQGRTFIP